MTDDTFDEDPEFQKQYQMDLAINNEDLSSEFIKHPALLSSYAGIYEAASDAYRRMKSDMEIFEAEARSEIRDKWNSDKRMTVDTVADALLTNKEYRVRKKRLLELEHEVETIKVCFESIREKGRVLLSLGTLKRAEMESGLWLGQKQRS